MSEAAGGMLTGDSILFVDGFDRALKIPDKGYPGMSLQKTESEKAIRGSNEGFGDSIKQNTALIRKRLALCGSESGRVQVWQTYRYECGYHVS